MKSMFRPAGECAELSPDNKFCCTLPEGHEGDHDGVELPVVYL